MLKRWLIIVAMFLLFGWRAHLQNECGIVERISHPIDTETWRLVQSFSAASPRHQGRFHTGEDWYGGRGMSAGSPVRAIANGRVTYSSPSGWGRDGGVIIIEHTFPDGSIAYSQYGHLGEGGIDSFPPRLSCVEAGQIIGVVGDARPAPHVHFEMRSGMADTPGPGYSWETPEDAGWLPPSQFILNWQGWLHPSHEWHTDNITPPQSLSPPLWLLDGGAVYIDGQRIKRLTSDGRVLWRINLNREAVAVTGYEGQPLLTYADGTMQLINLEGSLAEAWQTGYSFDSAPLFVGDYLMFHTSDNRLVLLDEARQSALWEVEGIPSYIRAYVAGDVSDFTVAIITQDRTIMTITRSGGLQYTGHLRDTGSFATATDGALLVYTRGGLWRVDKQGQWRLAKEDAPAGGGSSAILVTPDERMYLFDGQILYAFNRDGLALWQTPIPNVQGMTNLTVYGDKLLLSSSYGQLFALHSDGRRCGQLRVYGDATTRLYHELGRDNVLRVYSGNRLLGAHMMGIDWQVFTSACG